MRDFGGGKAQDLITNGSRRPPYNAAEGGILNCAAQAALLIYKPPAEPAPYGRRRRLTVPLSIFCKRHGRICPPPRHFDRAFGIFLQKARSVAPPAPRFRPCLWRFFAKGTVARTPCSAFSTVPLTIFCKKHGQSHPLLRHFDRAFDDFLQKARSVTPSVPRFRPCLCPFFAKGTVGCAPCSAFSTVPLPFFCERHGRLRPLPRIFGRAFDRFS